MSFQFFTVSIQQPDSAAAELYAFLQSHRVLAVDRYWVEQRGDELPVGESRQEHAGQPEQQPRLPCRPQLHPHAEAADGTDRSPVLTFR